MAAFYGAAVRTPADRLDRPERHLSLPADRTRAASSRSCGAASIAHHAGSPPAAAADRVQLRRVLRGRGGLRHAGRRDRGHFDRPRVLAARRVGPVADRQHRSGRLRRARHADHRAGAVTGLDLLRAQRDGRAAAAFLLGDRAVLADLGVRWLPRDDGDLAGRCWSPGIASRCRSSSSRTIHGPWLVDVVAAMVSMAAWRCSCASGSRRRLDWLSSTVIEAQREAAAVAAQAAAPAPTTRRSRRPSSGVDPVDDPERLRVHVGRAAGQDLPRRHFGRQIPVAGLHNLVLKVPPVVEAHAGSRGIRAELAVGDRNRHPAGGDHRRLRSWAIRRSACCACTGRTLVAACASRC